MPTVAFSRLFCVFLLLVMPCAAAYADDPPPASISLFNRPLTAVRVAQGAVLPKIDGDLSEPFWQQATKADIFFDPQTGKPTPDQTEVYLAYDSTAIYVGFYCHDTQPDRIVARETVRDAELDKDDNIQIELDPFLTYKFNDYTVFSVNPFGTQHVRMGGGRAGKLEWQGNWFAAAKRVKDGWTAEMQIPWGILSYPRSSGNVTMGINFRRWMPRTQIQTIWSDLGPQKFNEREGLWKDVQAPNQAWHPRLSALPYLMPSIYGKGGHSQNRFGLDLRYQPTPELTGVGTINPDFASVEGAIEGINFSRSERFVPDRRPFFLEGQDYFDLGRGYELGSYFNSARIGQFDTGLKFYGKVTPNTTVGMLGTFDVGNQANLITNIRREINATSNATFMWAQRLEPGADNSTLVFAPNIRRGKWGITGKIAQTLGPGAGGLGWTTSLDLQDKNLFATMRYRHVAANFLDSLGFIPFTDYHGWSSFISWSAPWRKGALRGFEVSLYPEWDSHLDGRPFRRRANLGISLETRSDYQFGLNIEGGKFNQDNDLTYSFNVGGNTSNRFRRWNLSLTTGKLADRPYTAFGPSLNWRLFGQFDISLSTFIQNYDTASQQYILTFNNQISPFKSWGGRLVLENSHFNIYLSYRNAGRGGTDTYFIIGDPNADSFAQRVMIKWVFAL